MKSVLTKVVKALKKGSVMCIPGSERKIVGYFFELTFFLIIFRIFDWIFEFIGKKGIT